MSKLVFSIQSSKILSEYYISVCSSLKSIIRLKYSDTFLSFLQLTGSSSHLLLYHGRAHFSELLVFCVGKSKCLERCEGE